MALLVVIISVGVHMYVNVCLLLLLPELLPPPAKLAPHTSPRLLLWSRRTQERPKKRTAALAQLSSGARTQRQCRGPQPWCCLQRHTSMTLQAAGYLPRHTAPLLLAASYIFGFAASYGPAAACIVIPSPL